MLPLRKTGSRNIREHYEFQSWPLETLDLGTVPGQGIPEASILLGCPGYHGGGPSSNQLWLLLFVAQVQK
jgi:hypothetical protein